jgi:serine/threonine protein kinase
MAGERWKRVNELFHEALDLDVSQRTRFLEVDCSAEDPAVIQEVNSLLSAHDSAGDFIQQPLTASQFESLDEDELPFACGQKIGVYEILKEIGRGGMGAVYLAQRADQSYEKLVAIKVLKRGMDTDELLHRFRKERQILATFDHPNISRLLDGGATESGLPYFVMEYVEGLPIDRYCNERRLNITQRLELFQEICSAISYAHRHLVIHRDIKPSNIIVTPEGVPKLLDFGIAKTLDPNADSGSTATGFRLMTPEYASPEQAIGLPVTTASDVYGLGVVLYELLTGHPPFRFSSRSPVEVARVLHDTQPFLPSTVVDHLAEGEEGKITPVSVSIARDTTPDHLRRRLRGDLDNVVLMAIRKEPERRYQSVEQFSEDIRKHLEGRPVIARKDTLSYRLSKFAKRNKIAVVTGVVVVLTLIGGIAGTTWQAHKAKAEQARAEYARAFGDEVRYIESLLLSTYTAPLHDIRPNLKLARDRLIQMEQRMHNGGEAAYGSGNNALGIGYLMLKDYQRAKAHLQKAWESDYKQPSTAYALGKVLGILYQESLADADELTGGAPKQKMVQEAQENFAKPAIEYLARAQTSAESPAYVEALIALYQKRFNDALRKASDALRSSSRPYEIFKLQGDIYLESGRVASARGNYEAERKSFLLAGKAYARAAEIARSEPDVYLADVQRLIRTISDAKTEAPDVVQTALELCDKAMQINPDSDRPYLYKSSVFFQQGINQMYFSSTDPTDAFRMAIGAAEQAGKQKSSPTAYEQANEAYLRLGEYQTAIGTDPRPSLMRAIEGTQKTLQLHPDYGDAYRNMAGAYFYVGEYALEHGEDPTASLTKVIDLFKNHPGLLTDSYSYNVLGLTYLSLAEYKLKRGLDSNPDLNAAVKNYTDGLRQNSNSPILHEGLALAYLDMAKDEIERGIVPDKSFDRSIQEYGEGIKKGGKESYSAFNRGLAYSSRAEYKVRIGQDPNPELDLAAADFQSILARHSELTSSFLQLAAIRFLRARYDFAREKDPTAELKRARDELNRYLATDNSSAEAFLVYGRIECLAAMWAMKKKSNPDPFFDQAIGKIEKSIQLNRQECDAHLELASIYRWRAQWTNRGGKSAAKWLAAGLEETLNAEKINPRKSETFAIRARLLMLKSRETSDPALSKEADDMLNRALEANPFLKAEYKATLIP